MARYRLAPQAEKDFRHIWRTIAIDNEPAADALLLRLDAKIELAAEHPHIGVPRPELGPDVRILIEGAYVVIYEPEPGGILIVGIVHGMRDTAHWLD